MTGVDFAQVAENLAKVKRALEGHKHVLNLLNESLMHLEHSVTEWVD